MAIKKSDLYSSIWASCDELRGGMDASQYKDYVLFMLFIKYVSDKYADYDGFEPPIVIPKGPASKTLAGPQATPTSATRITRRFTKRLIEATSRLARADFPNSTVPTNL